MGTKTTNKKPATKKKATPKKASLNKKVAKKIQSKKVADPVEKKITIICLIVSTIVVAASLFVGIFFNPEKIAKRKMEYLVADYYENYFYDNFVGTVEDDDSDKVFEKYAEIGFAPVYLRQLLLFDNRKHDDFNKYFTTKNYVCNKNVTRAQIFPVAPYGKTDYKVTYTYSCNYE